MTSAKADGKLAAVTYALMSLPDGFLLIKYLTIDLLGFNFDNDNL
jgi:hypothetical protein